MNMNSPIGEVKGVGEKTAALLEQLGIKTVGDMLGDVPRRYTDMGVFGTIGDAAVGDELTIRARVMGEPKRVFMKNGRNAFRFNAADGTGELTVWYFNQPYLLRKFANGSEFLFYGKIDVFGGALRMDNPACFAPDAQPGILAYYATRKGISQAKLRSVAAACLDAMPFYEDYSAEFLRRNSLLPDSQIYPRIHRPQTLCEQEEAQRSLVFKELLVFNRALELLEYPRETYPSPLISAREGDAERFSRLLGFEPTGAQKRVFAEIAADLASGRVMNRLVQGDVGSGKTAVAFFAMYLAVNSGFQCAMMAPTEVLAVQHAESARRIFGEEAVVLITGGQKAKERRDAVSRLKLGTARIAIGTHALVYGSAEFESLGLIITDEQHKFGVRQRAKLSGGDPGIHALIMTATPIPRTLALILYGSADISVIDELPPGRSPVKTFIVGRQKRAAMYEYAVDCAKKGEQAYIVCPLIENDETLELRSVSEIAKEFNFPGVRAEMLHGKLSTAEKNEIIARFRCGETQILISTTVIEVGIDVPAATIMIIENAERFGLAQLHQLRGRVGRGSAQSFCFLVCENARSLERLKVLKESNDGFYIAEKDLELRGPGEFLGQAQHGAGGLLAANLMRDVQQLVRSRDALRASFADPAFERDAARADMLAKRLISGGGMEIVLS